jgi:hypothetical protein
MTTAHSFSDLLVKKNVAVLEPLVSDVIALEVEATPNKEAGAFPPLDDTIIWWNNIDWDLQRERARGGVNNCGLVLAVIGTKLNDLGLWLSKV